jgi:signal transduction histidine kinase
MTDRGIAVVLRTAAAVGIALALTGSVVSVAAGHLGDWWFGHQGVAATVTVGLCAVVWVVVPRQPRNASVWALAPAPLGGLIVVASAVAPLVADAEPAALRYPSYVPAEHPATIAWLFMIAEPLTAIGVFVPVTLGLLLFPSGAVPSSRWRWVGWAAAASVATVSVAYVIAGRPGATQSPEDWVVLGLAQFAVLATMFLSVVALFARFRSSPSDVRQQIKWVLWGGAIAACSFTGAMITAGGRHEWMSPLLALSGFSVLIAAYGVAMVRYRLYDVDLVISRTIVYGSLAALVTGSYIAIVVGVGELLGVGEPNTFLAIMTTAGVAAAFQPLRRRVQRVANRVVYGRRSTPHDVLSEFTRRVAANDPRLLEQVAKSLVDGTAATHVEVRVDVDGLPVSAVGWPPDVENETGEASTFSIAQHGVDLGWLVITVPSGQRLTETDRVLVEQIAAGMGLALRNRALTETLERRVAELRDSRRRLVRVQDDTRRRLERDLHDGAQQQLVALRVKLGLAQAMAEQDGAETTLAALRRLVDDADCVVDTVREFARGVYPPLLEAEGLGPAIAALARRAPIDVTAASEDVGRYERDVESTVYACVVEALRDASSRAEVSGAAITIAEADGAVVFEVRDDGTGCDDAAPSLGALAKVVDRVDALAGTLSQSSSVGGGTRVVGVIPVNGEAPR